MIFFFILGVFSIMAFGEKPNKTAFINAKIYTGQKFNADASAFIVKNDRFFKIGSKEEIQNLIDKETKVIDLNGYLVIPGFIEAHAHLLGLGQSKMILDLKGLEKNDIVKAVIEQEKKQAKGTWIQGRGWDQNRWEDKSFPDHKLLSTVKNPVFLRRVDGHAAWLNRAALQLAGIDGMTKDPAGGQIIRDSQGMPTGILIDNAISLASQCLDKPKKTDLKQYLDLAMKEALSLGITSFHDAGIDKETVELYKDYAKNNKLKLRIYAMLNGEDKNLVNNFLKTGPLNINNFLVIKSIKYFADGALGSRGALLLEDYFDQPGYAGLALIDKNKLIQKTSIAINNGFQVATHAIGDRANKLVLDAYEEALSNTKLKNTRLRIEHAQLIDPRDHGRFKKLEIIASMQPIHCTSDMLWIKDRLGESRLKDRAYPWRSLLNHETILAFGSDAPVEDLNPMLGIYASVSRKRVFQTKKFEFLPEQKLRLREALNGYFFGAAYAEFNEHQKGKIAEGYLGDFVVFQSNFLHPYKSLFLQAKPFMTVVGGEIVYRSN
jgi:predicted amidohydrolase YtcJ